MKDEVRLKLRIIWSVKDQFTFLGQSSCELAVEESPAKFLRQEDSLEDLAEKAQKSLQRVGSYLQCEHQESRGVTKVTLSLKLGLPSSNII